MPFGIEAARNRLHQKLSRKLSGNKREFPWYKNATIMGNRIQVEVTDEDAARTVLQPTYYSHQLDVVADRPIAAPAPSPAPPAPGQNGQAQGPQGPQTPSGPQGPQAPGSEEE